MNIFDWFVPVWLISAYLCSLNKRPGGELKHSSNDWNLKLSLQVEKYVKEWQKQQSKEVIIEGRDSGVHVEEAESQSNYQLSKSPMTVAKAYFPSCYYDSTTACKYLLFWYTLIYA